MKVPAHGPLVLSFLLEAEHSLPIAKLAFLDMKMITAVNCYRSIDSFQSVNQDESGLGVDCCLLSFPCCLHVWQPMLLARHAVIQGSLASSESDCNIPRRRMRRAVVTSKTMKECLILCGMHTRCELRVLTEISNGTGSNVLVSFIIQS